jgi:tRNA A-37 threonylcarbamoyl transferase component Bud32
MCSLCLLLADNPLDEQQAIAVLLALLANNPNIKSVGRSRLVDLTHSIWNDSKLKSFVSLDRSNRAGALAWLEQQHDAACSEARRVALQIDAYTRPEPRADPQQTVQQFRAQIEHRDRTIDENKRTIDEYKRVIDEKDRTIESLRSRASEGVRVAVVEWIELRDEGLLGQGAYGEVRRMKWMGEAVAVKFINAGSGDRDLIATAQSEANVMAALHHPCIVSLYGITLGTDQCGLVMEYCSGGTLSDFLKNAANAMDDAMKIQMARQITSGIAYLHAHGVVHRDIKSSNVMLDASHHCKLIDFGLSRVRQHLTTLGVSSVKPGASIVGTLYWMAPEIVAHEDASTGIPYNKSTDMYALGITLWEIVTRKTPYLGCDGNIGVVAVWKVQGKHDAIPADAPGHLIEAIEWCRKSNPADRPSAAEVFDALENA